MTPRENKKPVKAGYKDKTLALRDRKLGLLEIGRDLSGWLETIAARPFEIDWQRRALIEKVSALLRSRRERDTIFINFDRHQHVLFRYLILAIGQRSESIRLKSTRLDLLQADNMLVEDIDEMMMNNIKSFESDELLLNSLNSNPDFFNVVLVPGLRPDLQRSVAVRFNQGYRGIMLVPDFSMERTPWPYDFLRQNNMVMIETADGFGECWSL
jgi:hypothetical protein